MTSQPVYASFWYLNIFEGRNFEKKTFNLWAQIHQLRVWLSFRSSTKQMLLHFVLIVEFLISYYYNFKMEIKILYFVRLAILKLRSFIVKTGDLISISAMY